MGWREKNRPEHFSSRFFRYWRGRKWKHGRCIRHMRTTAELRAYSREFCRAKRGPSRLPNAYDDFMISYERSWKSHRKSQFKPVEIQ